VNCVGGEWGTLLSVQAGAAATLTGLVFVAVSLNSAKVVSFAGLTGRAAESILQLLEVFFVATVVLVPGQSSHSLGLGVLGIGVICWVAQAVGQIRYLRIRAGHPWAWFAWRAGLGQLATLPFLAGGIDFLLGSCTTAMDWLVCGFVFSFAASMMSAWVLLIEILR
jgi:hypothetical protein